MRAFYLGFVVVALLWRAVLVASPLTDNCLLVLEIIAPETETVLAAVPAASGANDKLFQRRFFLGAGHALGERYLIVSRLGIGGDGGVFLVRPVDAPAAPVSVVRLCRNGTQANREADFLKRARAQPNGHLFLDVVRREGPLLEMPYIEGAKDLFKALAAGEVKPEQVRVILYQVALAMKAMHDAGFLHRDIKPSNILLLPNGEVRVIDLGIAIDRTATAVQRQGTHGFIPPEMEEMAVPSRKQDTYAWQRTGEELLAVMKDPATRKILEKLTDRERRFNNADDLLDALKKEWP